MRLYRKLTAIVAALLFIAATAQAQPAANLSQAEKMFTKFRPYEPNYAIWQLTENDDPAMEVRYSFKYLLNSLKGGVSNQRGAYLKFTGEFDFYMGSRPSSPVINRSSNPGIHYRQYKGGEDLADLLAWKYWDAGLQHLSNGQALDAEDQATVLQNTWLQDKNSVLFDDVSRSVNFFSLESSFRFGKNRQQKYGANSNGPEGRCDDDSTGCYNLWVRLIPFYIDDDNPVTWGQDAGRCDDIADYDRLRMVLTKQLQWNDVELGLEWTIGDEGFDTDSFDVFVNIPRIGKRELPVPIYIRYHNGPMNNLSDYTREQNSIGIGIRLY